MPQNGEREADVVGLDRLKNAQQEVAAFAGRSLMKFL
jgi:hypothetical protein